MIPSSYPEARVSDADTRIVSIAQLCRLSLCNTVCSVSHRVLVLLAGLRLACVEVLGLLPLPLVLLTVVRRKGADTGDCVAALHGEDGSEVTVITEGATLVEEGEDEVEGE